MFASAVEINASISNSFQMSAGIEEWLADRGGSRRRLSPADVDDWLSTGSGDFGIRATAEKSRRRNALAFNFDNTPDFGLHLSFAILID